MKGKSGDRYSLKEINCGVREREKEVREKGWIKTVCIFLGEVPVGSMYV